MVNDTVKGEALTFGPCIDGCSSLFDFWGVQGFAVLVPETERGNPARVVDRAAAAALSVRNGLPKFQVLLRMWRVESEDEAGEHGF